MCIRDRLILGVDVGNPALERVGFLARRLPEGLEVDQLRLGLADHCSHRTWREALRVEPHLGHDHLDEPAGVGVVVHGERGPVAQPVGVAAQDAQARGVEGRDPHLVGARPDQLGDAAAHLVGRLVGERDGQDPPGRRVAGGQQMADAPGQHPGLARTGAGHHQQGTPAVHHCRPLRKGQPLEQRGRGRAPARARRGPGVDVGVQSDLHSGGRRRIGRSCRTRVSVVVIIVGGGGEQLGWTLAPGRRAHSHSIVPGGFDVTSSATRLTPSTSLMRREAMRSTRS